jgi:beta-lysine 5,6-aminomutase alpha subunit
MRKLKLDQKKIDECRKLAKRIADDLQKLIVGYTTVSVERAILRLFGADGINELGVPYPNIVVSKIQEKKLLSHGVANIISYMMMRGNISFRKIINGLVSGKIDPFFDSDSPLGKRKKIMDELCRYGTERIKMAERERDRRLLSFPVERRPLLYAIVATGNVYEDIKQARSAVVNGADCIAVIRSTAQSLMDYVPYGPTTEGFGGTYATQENFRMMRKELDDITPKIGRYVYLVNYCSGLCMSEIAAMGAIERLDMMLNDAMYGVIFRDINMYRTFIDQHFSRMINAQAGIIINTGEDNYLTTSDAMENAHTVPVSDFINEQLALNAGLDEGQIGLGHAFEISPDTSNSFVYEVAHAQLIRELFPNSPIKYMPPTKHIHGNIFRTHAVDTLYNLASSITNQSIHLVGVLTEGIHTPHVHDRYLSLEGAHYVMNATCDLCHEIEFKKGGIIEKRAQMVLDNALRMLAEIARIGLISAIEEGFFADIKRDRKGGKGLEGVFEKSDIYVNPFIEQWGS